MDGKHGATHTNRNGQYQPPINTTHKRTGRPLRNPNAKTHKRCGITDRQSRRPFKKDEFQMVEGFKNTEVGVIPNDWDVIPISDITTLMTNGFVGTVKSHYTDYENGILYIQGYNVEENSFNYNGIKRVTEEFHKKHLKSCLQEGDLLTIQTGDIGVTTVVPAQLAGSNCHALIITRFKKGTAEPKFYSYYFNFSVGRRRLKEIETGSTMKHINVGDMIQLLIPYPTKAEQTAIATALNDADALIQQLEQLIAKKRNIKTGAMQELLKPKEGWEEKTLGEVTNIIRGGSPRPIEAYLTKDVDGINWIKIGDVDKSAKYIFSTEERIIPKGAAYSRAVKEGDFLLSNSMSFGRPYILKTSGCVHDGWLVIQNYEDTFVTNFLYYLLGFETTLNQYRNLAAGSTVLNLNKEIVTKVSVSYPNLEEQTRIAQILSDIDSEIEALERQLAKYKLLKQGMMQVLLTGKIRLVKPVQHG
jgi:type I restriction enzyme S subunit